jgi:hypothetical protein
MPVRILCDAIAFCYGPAAALIALIETLHANNPTAFTFDVLATGSTRELLARSFLPVNLLDVDSGDRGQLRGLDTSKYDAFINICNPYSFEQLRSPDLRTVYLDFLLWMHEGRAATHFAADLYIAENYPGTREWVSNRGKEIRNLKVVPPVIQPARYNPSEGKLLVGLGGLLSTLTPLGPAANYSSFVVSQIIEAARGTRFKQIVVACGESVMRTIGPRFNQPGLSFESFSHDAFLEQLSSAEAFVSHPGLYAVFEATLGGVPTALLPASNYTQVLQLRHYRRIGLASYSFSWEDLGLTPIQGDLPEAEGVKATIEQINEAQEDAKCASVLRSMLGSFLDLESTTLNEVGLRQRSISSQFGKDGPAHAARVLESWFQEQNPRARHHGS